MCSTRFQEDRDSSLDFITVFSFLFCGPEHVADSFRKEIAIGYEGP